MDVIRSLNSRFFAPQDQQHTAALVARFFEQGRKRWLQRGSHASDSPLVSWLRESSLRPSWRKQFERSTASLTIPPANRTFAVRHPLRVEKHGHKSEPYEPCVSKTGSASRSATSGNG